MYVMVQQFFCVILILYHCRILQLIHHLYHMLSHDVSLIGNKAVAAATLETDTVNKESAASMGA